MSSVIAICNIALSNIGKENINALTEASAEARACNQFYGHTRDMLLQGFPWTFATKSEPLAQVENDKVGQWAYAYQRPNDCLTVQWLRPNYGEQVSFPMSRNQELSYQYVVEGDKIYCNIETAVLRYTARITDPSKFPAMFADALSWHLAVRLAMPLTRDPKIRADAWQIAQSTTGSAQMSDANQERHSSDIQSEFVAARNHSSSRATVIISGNGQGVCENTWYDDGIWRD